MVKQKPDNGMSKDAFQVLIQEARTACDQDLDAMKDYLREQLVSMGPTTAKDSHGILQTCEDLADQYGLQGAVNVIKKYGCSDDGFIDFHARLITQGKEVYVDVLRGPDTLTDVEPYGDYCFECLSHVNDYAYEQLTGHSACNKMGPDRIEKMRDELKKDIVCKDGIQYSREPKNLPRFLSRLCEEYGGPERFLAVSSTWSYSFHEICRLLDEGKVQDVATKKKRGNDVR